MLYGLNSTSNQIPKIYGNNNQILDNRIKFFNPYTRERYSIVSDIFATNNKFYNSFEEPTYLGFHIEFGDWGASILNDATYKAQTHRTFDANAMNYDDFPCGLFDLHFYDNPSENNNQVFQSTNNSIEPYYNAVNYLYSRNEDTRATYLKAFIEGIFEIQREYPYIFQKISGVDKLLEFNSTRGQRLKDAKITIECLDFLDQRVKTLFHMYRKAAYDDVYQRWLLPDIYRSFKMIIYIQEFRNFHRSSSVTNRYSINNVNNGIDTVNEIFKTNIPNLTLFKNNFCLELDLTAGLFSSPGNGIEDRLPVLAFECSPCEIEIPNLLNKGDFETSSSEQEKFKFTVNVKNINIFQKNLLMDKLNVQTIGDILSSNTLGFSSGANLISSNTIDVSAISSMNIETYRYTWLRHAFDYYNKISSRFHHNYRLYSYNFKNELYTANLNRLYKNLKNSSLLLSTIGQSNAFTYLIANSIDSDLLKSKSKEEYDRLANQIKQSIYDNFLNIHLSIDSSISNDIIDNAVRDQFLHISVGDEENLLRNLIDSSLHSNFNKIDLYNQLVQASKSLKENEEETKTQMLQYIEYLKNNLLNNKEYLDKINEAIGNDRSYATDLDGGPIMTGKDMLSINTDVSLPSIENMQKINNNISIERQDMISPIYDINIPTQSMNGLKNTIKIEEQSMNGLIDNSSLSNQDMVGLTSFNYNPEFESIELIQDVSIEKNINMPNINSSIDSKLTNKISSTNLYNNFELEKIQIPEKLINNINSSISKDFQRISKEEIELPKQQLINLNKESNNSSNFQAVSLQEIKLSKNTNYPSINDNLQTQNNMQMNLLEDMQYSNNEEFMGLKDSSYNVYMKMQGLIDNISLNTNKIEKNNSSIQISKQEFNSLIKSHYNSSMNMYNIKDSSYSTNKNMNSLIDNSSKTNQNMQHIINNSSSNNMQMNSLVNNIKLKNDIENNTNYKLDLPNYQIPTTLNTSTNGISYTQLTTVISNLEKANMQLTGIINDKLDKHPKVKMEKLYNNMDRSYATDLDGGPNIKREDMDKPDRAKEKSTATKKSNKLVL